jgi:hypothetical protein
MRHPACGSRSNATAADSGGLFVYFPRSPDTGDMNATPTRGLSTGFQKIDDHLHPGSGRVVALLGLPDADTASLAVGFARRALEQGSVLINSANKETAIRISGSDSLLDLPSFDLTLLESALLAARPSMVVVDNIAGYQQPKSWTGSREDFLSSVVGKMALFSRRYHTDFVILAPLCEVDGALSISYVGAVLTEVADTVMTLRRLGDDGLAELKIEKNRSGDASVTQELLFDRAQGLFFMRQS